MLFRSLNVVKAFIDRLQAKVLGQEVLESFSPTQQVLKIVYEELCQILGGNAAKLKFASQSPTVILMAGLQGSGKTTTTGKLAGHLGATITALGQIEDVDAVEAGKQPFRRSHA